jgi:hypothetical protein
LLQSLPSSGWFFGVQIKITHPRPLETLTEPESLGKGRSFAVRGTLKRLPKDHEIWLLTQNEATGQLWPQAFFAVKYDHQQKTWVGKITAEGWKSVKIVAVVAPPSSQDFFRYFQHVGGLREKYEPLKRVPPECRNLASVQAFMP